MTKYRAKFAYRCKDCGACAPGNDVCIACKGTDILMFRSQREASAYDTLRLKHERGLIFDLELQPAYSVTINGKKVFTYRADFKFTDQGGETRVVDVKGFDTALSKLKRKCVEAQYGITIEVVR